jgi:flagellar biosynthetic protein FlhB
VNHLQLQLDLQLFAQEKTEKATPKKKQDSRKKGQVAKSMEIPGAFILFFSFLAMYLFSPFYKERIYKFFTVGFNEYLYWDVTAQNITTLFVQLIYEGLIFMSPIFIIVIVIAILGNFVQFGFLVSTDPLKPKLSKLNPIEGVKKIFGLRALVELLKSMIKLTVVGSVVYITLWNEIDTILKLSQMSLQDTLGYVANITVLLGMLIGLILIALSIFDYMYQKYEYEKNLKMSKQDIKDEYKKSEGDPLIKGKIREKQRRMAMQRMMQDIPKADVVITNPTHFAIAIQYDPSEMEAPIVLAKGMDFIALKIKEAAKEHGIVLMENKPLARALYDQVEIGGSIPHDLFQAVAEVLAYVYKLKGNVK